MRGVPARSGRATGAATGGVYERLDSAFIERTRVIADLDLVCRVVDSGVHDVRICFERGLKLVRAAGAIEVGNPNSNHCYVLCEALSGGH